MNILTSGKKFEVNLFHRNVSLTFSFFIDRTTIKQEMEAAIKGRQWPLSVFGPFKEKTNLIPDEFDLSFEECRMQFLEAQASNNFSMYQQQLINKIQEANSRMHSLLNVNKDVLQMAVNIYNNDNSYGGGAQGNAMGTSGTGMFGAASSNTNTFGGNANAASSIFGGGSNSAASIFGGSHASTQNNTSSIFGGGLQSSATQPNANSIFGGGGTQTAGTFGMQAAQSNSIFGGAMTNTPATSSLFGQSNAPQQATTGSIFGQTSTFGSQQPQQSIFSKANAPPAFGSSAFGSGPVAPTAPSGLFGSAAASAFGTQPQPFQSNPPQNASPFGMQGTTQSTFGQAATLGYAQSFGGTSAPFTSQLQQTMSQPTQNSSNIFGNLGQQATLTSFANQMPAQQQQGSPFGTQAPPPAFGTNVQANVMQSQSNDSTLYSKMDELNPDQLAAFQADHFILGQIPNVAPPKELC